MTIFNTLDEVDADVGADLGVSRWIDITQERINTFAETTEDHSGPIPIPRLRRLVRTELQSRTGSSRCRFLPLSAKTYSQLTRRAPV